MLSIAGLQLALEDGNNFDQIAAELRRLKARLPWVQVAVLSELATHGASTSRAEEVSGATETLYCQIARELELWLIPGSLFQRDGDTIRNATPVIAPDGSVVARYAKMFPFLPYEKGVAAGAEYVVFEIPGVGRIGISNCYDMWFPETIRTMAAMGAEVIVHPSMTNTVDRDVELARANAAMFQLYLLDVNAAGAQGNGRSGMYGPGGEKIYEAAVRNSALDLFLPIKRRNASRSGAIQRSCVRGGLAIDGKRFVFREIGGAGGIRTLDTLLAYTHFPGERLRPLGHRSAIRWKAAI